MRSLEVGWPFRVILNWAKKTRPNHNFWPCTVLKTGHNLVQSSSLQLRAIPWRDSVVSYHQPTLSSCKNESLSPEVSGWCRTVSTINVSYVISNLFFTAILGSNRYYLFFFPTQKCIIYCIFYFTTLPYSITISSVFDLLGGLRMQGLILIFLKIHHSLKDNLTCDFTFT